MTMNLRRSITKLIPAPERRYIKSRLSWLMKGKTGKRLQASLARIETSGPIDFSKIRAIIHLGDGSRGAHHIYQQWRDVFISAQVPFVCVIRKTHIFDICRAQYPKDFFIQASNAVAINTVVSMLPDLKVVFYTGNTGNNVHFLAFENIKQIFIGHGDSDKGTSSLRMFRVYDEVWVAVQAHIDRISVNSPNVSTRVVGRPQVKRLIDQTQDSAFIKNDVCKVVYLPTWEGATEYFNYSSLDLAYELVKSVQDIGFQLHVKLHPSTGNRLGISSKIKEKLESLCLSGSSLYESDKNVVDLMVDADICITDTSSIVSDWLTTKKPIFIYYPKDIHIKVGAQYEDFAYIFSTANEFNELLKKVIVEGNDHKKQAREAISEYLVSSKATRNELFTLALHDVVSDVDN